MSRAAVFAVFALAHFLSTFLRSTNAVIAGDLTRDVGLDASSLGLMSSVYFLAFAAAQLPLGSALDRYGARITTPALMALAVVGCLVFASGDSFAALATGRALLGVGTAGILMGGLKALSGWYAPARFALMSGVLVAIGSSGALLAATPLAWMAQTFGWRVVFVAGALAMAVAAAAVALWGRAAPDQDPRLQASQGSFADVFRRSRFWRVAAMAVAATGVMFAVQTLWAGPYLTLGVGLGDLAAGNVLTLLGIGASSGFALLGLAAARFGVVRTIAVAMSIFVATQVLLAGVPAPGTGVLGTGFALLGVSGAVSALLFTLVRSTFPLALTGRAVTAVNLFMFAGGFVIQWGLGVWLELGPAGPGSLFALTALLGAGALAAFLPELRTGREARLARDGSP